MTEKEIQSYRQDEIDAAKARLEKMEERAIQVVGEARAAFRELTHRIIEERLAMREDVKWKPRAHVCDPIGGGQGQPLATKDPVMTTSERTLSI